MKKYTIYYWIISISLMMNINTNAFCQIPKSFSNAIITDVKNHSQLVKELLLREMPGGSWVGGTPSMESIEIPYKTIKDHKELIIKVPFKEIACLEFKRQPKLEAVYSDLIIFKRDSTKLIISPYNTTIKYSRGNTLIHTDICNKTTLPAILTNGEIEQGLPYLLNSFEARIDTTLEADNFGFWSATYYDGKKLWYINWENIKRIDFLK
jgi:hypothetical protein